MEKELVEGQIGKIGKYELNFKDGEISLEVGVKAGPGEVALVAKLDGKSVALVALAWLKEKIPGQIDDAVINVIEEKLKEV